MTDYARRVFKQHVQGPNFMTPHALRYGLVGKHYVYELSTGDNFCGHEMFGVSVIDRRTGYVNHELSQLHRSRTEAEAWIEGLEIGLGVADANERS